MASNIKYSVFRYTPSFITAESIVLGILIDIDDEIKFHHSINYNRIKQFDDELDIDELKKMFKSFEIELTSNIINNSSIIYDKIRHFVNEFSFDPINQINDVVDPDETIERLKKLYLKFDYEKEKRLSKNEEFKIINTILRSNNIDYKQKQGVVGDFTENIVYDYIFNDYGIKFFSFNSKKLKLSLNSVKAWAWNCSNNKNIKTVFIYDYDEDEYPESKNEVAIILEILKSATENVFNIQQGVEFVGNVSK